ncbi:MAG: response regulator [Terriglobales bacterium]
MARKILLADDSVTAQNMGRKILVDAGYEVVTVNNGSAALKRVNESKPDLIILDVYMPGYSGLEVCQRLKEAPGTTYIPVLLTVGKLEPFKPDEARRARADAHIVKPFEASELLSAVARLEDHMVPLADGSSQTPKAMGGNGSAKTAARTPIGDESPRAHSAQKKKEKDEATAVSVDPAATFHEFRKASAKPSSQAPAAHATTVEPEAPAAADPDLPRDITPDELDALSALAARLDNPYLAASMASQPKKKSQVEEFADTEPVNAAQFTQQSATIDQRDEPFFAAASTASPEALSGSATHDMVPASDMAAGTQRAEGGTPERGAEELTIAASQFGAEPSAEATTQNTATGEEFLHTNFVASTPFAPPIGSHESVQTDTPPTDEELAQALRLLTPAAGQDVTSPSHGVTADHFFAKGATTTHSSSLRWIAETVALTPEEASLSLEAEMFGASTAASPGITVPTPVANQALTSDQPIENQIAEETMVRPASSSDSSASSAPASIADSAPFAAAPAFNAAEQVSQEAHQPEAPQQEFTVPLPTEAELAAAVSAQMSEPNAIEPCLSQPYAAPAQEDQVEAPKAMAAAAAAETAPPDPSTIASIVESVLADLRPRIVEEITRKLSGK